MTANRKKIPLQRMLALLFALVAAWLLWSGLFKPLLLFFGAVSCVLTFWLVERMGYFEGRLFALSFSLRLFRYWIWLGGEIIKSSIDVARVILDPRMPISPCVVEIKAESPRPFDQVILGNSITLTPGTLSLDVYKGLIKVHALTESGARELMGGEMNRRVTEVSKP